MSYVGPFLLLLGPLVVIHELGHFLVAKWFNVKVETFSVGFGPAIFRRRVGETEYVLSWLPLGGYVKMLGEGPEDDLTEEERLRSFNGQSPLRRIAIALAGPGMNMLLSVVVVAGLYMTGWPTPTSRIGSVAPDSAAADAGLVAGDRVVSVDGDEIWRWADLDTAVRESDGASLLLGVQRGDDRLELNVAPRHANGRFVLGILHARATALLGVPDPDSPAAAAGLSTGDTVLQLNGNAVIDWFDFVRQLKLASGDLQVEVERDLDEDTEIVRLRVAAQSPEAWTLAALGTVRVDYRLRFIEPSSPAKRAGLLPGDLPLRFGSEPITSAASFIASIQGSKGVAHQLTVLRRGREVEVKVVPEQRTRPVGDGSETVYVVGAHLSYAGSDGEIRDEVMWNPLTALWAGTTRTAQVFALTIDGLGKLVTGKIGAENLAGPIGIGEIAGESFSREGWFSFLTIMYIISVNLAIINLLPIPVLDGGHIAFAVAEAASGGPIGARAREIAQTVGISLILMLMGFAFWNDLSRSWSGILDWFKGLV